MTNQIKKQKLYKHITGILALILTLMFAATSHAGDCTEGQEFYAAKLDSQPAATIDEVMDALWCLVAEPVPYLVMGYKTPFRNKKKLEETRGFNSPYRDLVLKSTQQWLGQSDLTSTQKFYFLRIRVFLGDVAIWPEAQKLSDQVSASGDNDMPEADTTLILMAGLGKITQAIDWIVQQDAQIKARYKTKPHFSFRSRMNGLNALAYMDHPAAWSLLEKYAKDPDEVPEIRNHASRLITDLK